MAARIRDICPKTPDGKHQPYNFVTARQGKLGSEKRCSSCGKILKKWKKTS